MKFSKRFIMIFMFTLIVISTLFSLNTIATKSNASTDKNNTKLKEANTSEKQENVVVESKVLASKDKEVSKEQQRRLNITYEKNNITIKSGLTEEELKKVLQTYNGASTMAHLARAFVDAEQLHNVNAFTLAAIVALESGFATSRRAVEDNNLTGFEVYTDESEGRLFENQYESVVYTAKHLANNYLTEGALYYEGLSIDDVQVHYCPDEGKNKQWEVKVDKLASGFLKVYKELYT